VRAHVEESFGPGALERARSGLCRHTVSGGHIPLSRRSKKVMELSLREALRLRDDHIGTEHILLALLREGEGLAVRMLADAGVRAQELRTSVLSALGKVA
jgi:ATP-dependent Clp protease ATP-binding subunit ClpA